MIQELKSKFDNLKTWQKVLVVAIGIVCLPIAVAVGLLLFRKIDEDPISETLIDQKKDNLEERIERAEKKDKELLSKEEAIKIEKKALQETISESERDHAKYSKLIDGASSIDELRAIARELRGSRP